MEPEIGNRESKIEVPASFLTFSYGFRLPVSVFRPPNIIPAHENLFRP